MKRIIRPESEAGTPRSLSDTLPSSGQSDALCSDPPDVRDAFTSDSAGAAPVEAALQQSTDANAMLMQQMMQQLHVDHGTRTRQYKGGSVRTDVSTVLQHQQVAQIEAMAGACRANNRPLKHFHFHAHAKTDQTQPLGDFDLGDYDKGQGSASKGQRCDAALLLLQCLFVTTWAGTSKCRSSAVTGTAAPTTPSSWTAS